MCDPSTCEFCCITNSNGVSECVNDILRCRFKTNADFSKILIFLILLISWLKVLPFLLKLFENFLIFKIYKNQSCFDLLIGFFVMIFGFFKFSKKNSKNYKSNGGNMRNSIQIKNNLLKKNFNTLLTKLKFEKNDFVKDNQE